jgi:predicted RNA binding protein YcfA (HicA-like mRNA interferase family)
MPIDFGKLRSLTARQLVSALQRDGFVLSRLTGSHRHYLDARTRRRVTLPFHGSGQTYQQALLRSMIEDQARWTEDDLRRLKLLP